MSVRTEKNGPVSTIILSNPETRNAVDGPTAQLLFTAFEEFNVDPTAKIAVLWGEGGTFCSGADLKAVGTPRQNRVEIAGGAPMGPSRLLLDKPVIAAVAGHAVAGGMELACWADLRVVEEDAIFGVFCRRWGVPLIDGGTVRLPRLIGLSRAMDLILTGRPVDANEALQIGLANRVVAKGTARQEAETLAAGIAAFPELCMQIDRRSAISQFDFELTDALRRELEGGKAALRSEGVSGAARFAEGHGRHGDFNRPGRG